jgi:hypothetical protein
MATDNKSPSYLKERAAVRKWLSETEEGRYAVDLMRAQEGPAAVSRILDDDKWVGWADLIEEHKNDLTIAANCHEVRKAVDLARKSNSLSAPPTSQGGKWLRFFTPEMGYVLRRQVETMDPDYWNDPKNVFREALRNPQWLTVPAELIRGELEKYLGTTRQAAEGVPLPDSGPSSEVAGS